MFSGTSSASPIVVGSLCSAQGILRATSAPSLTPSSVRALLRQTGTAQEASETAPLSERIGNLPDIRALVEAAMSGKDGTDGKEGKEDKDKEKEKETADEGKRLGGKNEFKDLLRSEGGTEPTPYSVALDERLQEVEHAVAELRHFITEEERPDLGAGARAAARASRQATSNDRGAT
jgi:hypothetical protein